MPDYAHGTKRKNWDKHGERPSLLDFEGIVGDGVNDDAAGINNAIADVIAAGGLALHIPGGCTFLVKSPILLPAGALNFTLSGEGDSSIIKRGANMTAGDGVITVSGSNVALRNFVIEGAVTVAAGVQYGTFSDPMDATLTGNSSIWIKGGASDVVINRVRIFHTGGYAILLDATAGDIDNVTVTGCTLRNNRPHLFGPSGDLNYGSWTGGIHYQGDGTSHRAANVLISGCAFQRCVGNQIWGHAYAFTKMHANVRAMGNTFVDIGRDCVELGNTIGGQVSGNTGRRIGYIATDDVSAAQPKYLAGQYAVFIDTSGTSGVDYLNNSCISALGAFFDLDGFAFGRVSGNVCRVPAATDPEYAEDLISSWPGNYTYGVQTANNYYAPGGTNVAITDNTFVNCAMGAIRLFAARGCHISGNTINHPAAASFPPIMLGNFVPASGGGQVDTANTDIVANNIQWSPASSEAAIQEIENWGAGSLPWAGETNWIAGNHCFGANVTEFSKAASSNSIAGTLISNASTMPSAAGFSSLQADATTLKLSVNGDTAKAVARVGGAATHVQFNDASGVNLGGSANLTWDNTGNVLTVGGGATTGMSAYAFSSRAAGSDIGFQLASSKFLVDGNGNVTCSAAMSPKYFAIQNSSAPARSAGFGYLYADASGVYISVNGGTFATIPTVGGGTTQVQFNSSGALAGSANLTWSGTVLTIGGGAATGVAAYAFNSQATGTNVGFQLASNKFLVDGNGNVTCSAAMSPLYVAIQNGVAPARSAGFGYIYADSGGVYVSVNGGAFAALASVGGSTTQVQFNSSGALAGSANLTWSGTVLTIGGGAATGVAAYSFNSQATGANIGFQLANSNFEVDGNGNVTCSAAMSPKYLAIQNGTAPTRSAGFGYVYVDAGGIYLSVNGGAFANVISAANAWVSGGGVLCPHAASIAGGNFFVTKNSDTAYISGVDDNFLDQGGTARYFVGGIYIGTSPISR